MKQENTMFCIPKSPTTPLALPLTEFMHDLKNSLDLGWAKLRNGASFKVYTEAFDFFMKIGLYEGLFRPYIPNPVYDNAAKELGQDFLEKSLELGLTFKELFPGNFSLSNEDVINGYECRIFYLTVYQERKKAGIFKLTFPHCHDHFDFPHPPTLEVVE